MCLEQYQKLQGGSINCKLTLLPGLIIPWQKNAVYLSFFSQKIPSTWIIFNKQGGVRVKQKVVVDSQVVLSPRLRPLFQTPPCIETVWYSRDTRMAVAYTYENVLYLLPDPVWVIDEKRMRLWKPHYSIVNNNKKDYYSIREIKKSHLHPQSPAWSVFEGDKIEKPFNYYLEKSLMWGVMIYNLKKNKYKG